MGLKEIDKRLDDLSDMLESIQGDIEQLREEEPDEEEDRIRRLEEERDSLIGDLEELTSELIECLEEMNVDCHTIENGLARLDDINAEIQEWTDNYDPVEDM